MYDDCLNIIKNFILLYFYYFIKNIVPLAFSISYMTLNANLVNTYNQFLIGTLNKIIFKPSSSWISEDYFYIDDLRFKHFLYFFHKNILSYSSNFLLRRNFNFEFFYFYFLIFSLYTTTSKLSKFIRISKPIFRQGLRSHYKFSNNHSRSFKSISFNKKIFKKLNSFNLNKKKIYLNLTVKKILLFYNRKLALLTLKFNVYNILGSQLSRRLRIFFNSFIRHYLSEQYYMKKDVSSFIQYLRDLSNASFRDSRIFQNIHFKFKKLISKKFSLYFKTSFDKIIFFSSLKNYFFTILNYTSFTFIQSFFSFFHFFIVNFVKIKNKLLQPKKKIENIFSPWILHFKIKPTKTFYFTLTNSRGEVKFHFSNNYLFNTVKKAKYKIEISKSLKKILLRFLKKNNIFFVHSFYTSVVTKKFVIPLFKFLKRNSINIKNIIFYKKIPHSNHLKIKLRKKRRI